MKNIQYQSHVGTNKQEQAKIKILTKLTEYIAAKNPAININENIPDDGGKYRQICDAVNRASALHRNIEINELSPNNSSVNLPDHKSTRQNFYTANRNLAADIIFSEFNTLDAKDQDPELITAVTNFFMHQATDIRAVILRISELMVTHRKNSPSTQPTISSELKTPTTTNPKQNNGSEGEKKPFMAEIQYLTLDGTDQQEAAKVAVLTELNRHICEKSGVDALTSQQLISQKIKAAKYQVESRSGIIVTSISKEEKDLFDATHYPQSRNTAANLIFKAYDALPKEHKDETLIQAVTQLFTNPAADEKTAMSRIHELTPRPPENSNPSSPTQLPQPGDSPQTNIVSERGVDGVSSSGSNSSDTAPHSSEEEKKPVMTDILYNLSSGFKFI